MSSIVVHLARTTASSQTSLCPRPCPASSADRRWSCQWHTRARARRHSLHLIRVRSGPSRLRYTSSTYRQHATFWGASEADRLCSQSLCALSCVQHRPLEPANSDRGLVSWRNAIYTCLCCSAAVIRYGAAVRNNAHFSVYHHAQLEAFGLAGDEALSADAVEQLCTQVLLCLGVSSRTLTLEQPRQEIEATRQVRLRPCERGFRIRYLAGSATRATGRNAVERQCSPRLRCARGR